MGKMILNKNINEFDSLEIHVKQKLHTFREFIKRKIYLIDARVFERTYKEEWEENNILLDKMKIDNQKLKRRNDILEKKNKILLRKIVKLKREVEK